ncbi:hypothetical protein TNCV_765091 [Trichonephila clavipes]|nr:hypothetical protein TNCV_765091 [Trichonephila clavipes]
MTECLHISAQMYEVHWKQHTHSDGLGGMVRKIARPCSPDLSCLDFFIFVHMYRLVYASPVDSDEALVAGLPS